MRIEIRNDSVLLDGYVNAVARDSRPMLDENGEKFVEQISYIMTELNVLHPFREGNGRTIRELVREICFDCGYVIDWYEINHDDILRAAKLAVLDEREQIKMLRRSIKKMV